MPRIVFVLYDLYMEVSLVITQFYTKQNSHLVASLNKSLLLYWLEHIYLRKPVER